MIAREAWCDAREKRKTIHAIYVDFSKAFDRVDHALLLQELCNIGISGSLLQWMKVFVSRRRWQVKVNDELSMEKHATGGVPQGSVLGPRLFTLYINSLPSRLNSPCLFFADDLKIWRVIDGPEDEVQLQADLDNVAQWCQEYKLPINAAKSGFMLLRVARGSESYRIGDEVIPQTNIVKDLGVLTQDNLKTHSHTALARTRGLKVLWMLKRTFHTWTPTLFRMLNTVFIRPVIEYGQPA
jgi:ribonuclease P/MRP protein subunit RPP40